MNRRAFLGLLGLGVLGGTGLGAYGLASARGFELSRHRYGLPGLRQPLRVAHLSDLHFGEQHPAQAVRRWVAVALAERPDLVVITGDFVDQATRPRALRSLGDELARLEAPLGVYGVLGNHDYSHSVDNADRRAWLSSLTTELERAGIELLTNRGVRLRPDLYLAGVDDLWHGNPDLAAALRDAPRDAATLLLSHNPDLLPQVPEWVSLTLCGHTHGGQVCLPLIGAVHAPSRYGTRFAQGFHRAPAAGFVSRGLGTTWLPVRTFCDAEVVVFDFEPVG
ncbi:metallophosphoesterase [Calidithermus chliarophilus]|uniref:metallophosphoesterase n=1 Tax=Calidithermus chliarophilus TaxID=52023 RepID=UPI000489031B|nr:metallophosphoesterase [Calidithermus chliarophilus]